MPEQFADLLGYSIDCNQIIGFRVAVSDSAPSFSDFRSEPTISMASVVAIGPTATSTREYHPSAAP